MGGWRVVREPSLDEVLAEDIIQAITRKAGLSPAELRRELAVIARRIADRQPDCASCRGVGFE